MNRTEIVKALNERVADLPMLDAHTHLVGGRLSARGLHDVLLYHMSVSDLYAAGCPSGSRLTQYPGWPSDEEAHNRIREALPFLRHVRNTNIAWGIRIILRDLYDWTDDVTENNWRDLDARIRERADDRSWARDIIRAARIRRLSTEIARREQGQDDDILQYSLEWAFFTRCQWGEYDTALYELERCWGRKPESPSPIGTGQRPPTDRVIRSVDDVHEAMAWYVDQIPLLPVLCTATHFSTDINYRLVNDDEMQRALARRNTAGQEERDIYASYINEVFLQAFAAKCGPQPNGRPALVFQFSTAAEPLPFETASRLSQTTIRQLAEMISRHPAVHFQCHLASAHANQSLCTMVRELPNFSLAACWWHSFFPSIMRRVLAERLDMIPLNKQISFFSDAYCVEWTYAKSVITKRILVEVLADKVELGQYDLDLAVDVARETIYESPQTLLNMKPAAV